MTTLTGNFELLHDLPIHPFPRPAFLDIHTLVPQLLDLYPEWTLEDFGEFIESRTGKPIHAEDRDTLTAVYHRCVRLRQDFEGRSR